MPQCVWNACKYALNFLGIVCSTRNHFFLKGGRKAAFYRQNHHIRLRPPAQLPLASGESSQASCEDIFRTTCRETPNPNAVSGRMKGGIPSKNYEICLRLSEAQAQKLQQDAKACGLSKTAYGDGENPVVLKSEFLLSLCEQLVGSYKLNAREKSIIDRCTANVYRYYLQGNYQGQAPTLQDFHAELLKQPEPEARDVALAMELFTDGSLNTFAKPTNVDTNARILCYDIRDLGKQLLPIGMLVVLDSIFNRIIRNRTLGKRTWIYIDEIYLLFQHEYSANFLFTLWKRVRKYGACCTGITQNVADLLQSHTARTMLANSEFLVMLNQAPTDRVELARLLNISDDQLSYITDVEVGHGLLKCGSTLVPFEDNFPRNTQLYKLMSTKPSDQEL